MIYIEDYKIKNHILTHLEAGIALIKCCWGECCRLVADADDVVFGLFCIELCCG